MSWREALLWGTAIVVTFGAVLFAAYISLQYFIPVYRPQSRFPRGKQ